MYNRWMPVQCSSELYHYGVKGMKWGKHLMSKGVELLQGGGGGAAEEDPELAELMEKFKKGLISRDALLKAKNAIDAKRKTEAAIATTSNDTSTTFINRPRGRKRNVTGQGTGVQIGESINSTSESNTPSNRPRGRKRNVTGQGAGVQIGEAVNSTTAKRPRGRRRNVTGQGTGVQIGEPIKTRRRW